MNNELYHYGVLGMKWGVRRYQPYGEGGYNPKRFQNKDGGLNKRGQRFNQRQKDKYERFRNAAEYNVRNVNKDEYNKIVKEYIDARKAHRQSFTREMKRWQYGDYGDIDYEEFKIRQINNRKKEIRRSNQASKRLEKYLKEAIYASPNSRLTLTQLNSDATIKKRVEYGEETIKYLLNKIKRDNDLFY